MKKENQSIYRITFTAVMAAILYAAVRPALKNAGLLKKL